MILTIYKLISVLNVINENVLKMKLLIKTI